LALIGLVAGALVALVLPEGSTAVTRIYVVHENEQPDDRESLLETDVALLETTRVAAAALDRTGEAGRPEDFLDVYSAEVVAGNVLEITTYGRDDAQAVPRAEALAAAFIADHVGRTNEAAQADAQALLDRRSQAERDLAALSDRIGTTARQPAGLELATQLEALYAQRAALESQIQQLGQRAEEASIGAPASRLVLRSSNVMSGPKSPAQPAVGRSRSTPAATRKIQAMTRQDPRHPGDLRPRAEIAAKRWPAERTHSSMNGYGKLGPPQEQAEDHAANVAQWPPASRWRNDGRPQYGMDGSGLVINTQS
jgi:hypothetical protein